MNKTFSFRYGNREWTAEFTDRIDWAANPTEGPARTHLWNEALNRHFHFNDLSRAYWETGQERYVECLVEHWLDWVRQNPRPRLSSGNRAPGGSYAWQTLTTGIRLENVWLNALYRCFAAPSMTPDVVTTVAKSVADQARHLMRWPTGGNWLTEESMGLFTAGMMFPEFKDAIQWRKTGIERLYRQLDDEVYPDGMEYELAAGYNNWVVSNVSNLVERAQMNGIEAELPTDFLAKTEKMYNYQVCAMMPDGRIPGLNDSGNADVRSSLMRGFGMFPHRRDFLFGATLGADGEQPAHTSSAFPYSGHYVMRSGWDAGAVYALFDSGPFGYGHQHEDKLHLVLYAYGRQHLLDPGNYSYDRSKWRRYVLGTHGHNTVMVDGQGQNRRGNRETYFWPRPWTAPKPAGDDTVWHSTAVADYARGRYRDGYGAKGNIKVVHTRQILYLKPALLLVRDVLRPEDNGDHTYDALFHLDTETANLEEATLVARTQNEKQSNLSIIPVDPKQWNARIATGEEDPVQGWANGPWREIPTVIYSQRVSAEAEFCFLLCPVPAETIRPVVSVRRVDGSPGEGQSTACSIELADGSTDLVLFNDRPGAEISVAGLRSDTEILWVRRDKQGNERVRFTAGSSD